MKIKKLILFYAYGENITNVSAYDEAGQLRAELTADKFNCEAFESFLTMCQEKALQVIE